VFSIKDQRAKGQNMFVDMNTFRKTNRKTFVHQVGEVVLVTAGGVRKSLPGRLVPVSHMLYA